MITSTGATEGAHTIVVNRLAASERKVHDAGLAATRVLFEPEAVGRTVSGLRGWDAAEGPHAIVHVDAASTDFIVTSEGKPLFVRSIPVGAQHLAVEETDYRGKLAEEMKRFAREREGESDDESEKP